MEPPKKRLRILQSVEVDETNPDYINAKQQQQQKFKGRLESIFAKYEHMHESMSDEIDMRENKVVVDRGHLRRLARQVNRNETVLLDNLGLGNAPEPEDEVEEEKKKKKEVDGGDSEDELAPTQPPKSSSRAETKHQHGTIATKDAHPSPSNSNQTLQQTTNLTPGAVIPASPHPILNTPNPAADLLSLVQFPQTPAGQQAQTSFYATLAQTINQAVQQAVAPLFSNIFPNTPSVQLPFANPPAMPTMNSDRIAPATDPKWFFPPLSAEPGRPEVVPSSPIPVPTCPSPSGVDSIQRSNEATLEEEKSLQSIEGDHSSQQATISVGALIQSEEPAECQSARASRRTCPRVEIQRKQVHRKAKYQFTEEDDIHIMKQRTSHKCTWAEIKDSRKRWRNWPMWVLQHHWSQQLKGKSLLMKDLLDAQVVSEHSEDLTAASPSHHLPTPSSLDNDDSHEQIDRESKDQMEIVRSSSAHFNEDERDLLSLASGESDEEELPLGNAEGEAFFPEADEVIIQSVEFTAFVDEDALQQGLLEDSPMEEASPTMAKPITLVKVEPQFSSPTNKRRRKDAPRPHQANPDAESEAEYDGCVVPNSGSKAKKVLVCDICHETFMGVKDLQRHQDNPHLTHAKARSIPASVSIDLVGDDELQAPALTSPHVKREFSTPPPTSFLFSTPAAQSRAYVELPSSGVQSASGISRNAYLKQIKQSWTKKSTSAPNAVKKRSSFHTVSKKRAWAGDAESDDELGF
jgi:hypothetical protein